MAMMVPIDEFTICFVAAVVAMTFGAAFFALWLRFAHARYLLRWAAAGSSYGLGIMIFLIPNQHRLILPGAIAYALLAGSTALIVAGVRRFEETPAAPFLLVAIAAPPPVTYCLTALMHASDPSTLPAGIALTISLTLGGVTLASNAPLPATGWRRIVGLSLLGFLPSYGMTIGAHFLADPVFDAATRLVYLSHLPLLLLTYVGLLAMPGARAIARLREIGYRDALTGLRNRAWLADHAASWAAPGTGVAIIDVDHFKQINDSFGHASGDAVLAQIGDRLASVAAALGGEAIRMGGDEFVLLVPDQSSALALLANRLMSLCSATAGIPAWRISYGMAKWRPGDGDIHPAIRRADSDLYRAKRGRPLARAA